MFRYTSAGWPMALAVGDTNSPEEFVSPTSEEVGHPPVPNARALEHWWASHQWHPSFDESQNTRNLSLAGWRDGWHGVLI